MGVLDDAIRQHLELRRKHGANDEELARQEAEALGPARRDVSRAREDAAPGSSAPREPDMGDRAAADEVAREERHEPSHSEAPFESGPASGRLTADDLVAEDRAEEVVAGDEAALPESVLTDDELAALDDDIADDEEEVGADDDLVDEDEPFEDDEELVEEEELTQIRQLPDDDDLTGDDGLPASDVPTGAGLSPEDEETLEHELLEDEPDPPIGEPPSESPPREGEGEDSRRDAPEHDRLWFEQGRPRGFDLDE